MLGGSWVVQKQEVIIFLLWLTSTVTLLLSPYYITTHEPPK